MIEAHSITNSRSGRYHFLFRHPMNDDTIEQASQFIESWAADKGWAPVKKRAKGNEMMFVVQAWLQ